LRNAISLTAIVVLGVVLFVGLIRYRGVTASDNVTPHDADVDWSGNVDLRDPLASLSQFGAQAIGGRPVTETNVDASGSIRVAQQGPIDVNVVSTNAPSTSVILVAENMVVPHAPNVFQYSPYVDVSVCRFITAFYELTIDGAPLSPGNVDIVMRSSIDGANPYPGIDSTVNVQFEASATTVRQSLALRWSGHSAGLLTPYVTAQLSNWDPDLAGRTVTASIWLYCAS
jgi:hypothetical protein